MEEINLLSSEIAPYLFDKNPCPMVIFDRYSLQIVKVNEAACERYGYSREEFRNLDLTQIRPKEDIPLLKANLKKTDPKNRNSVYRHLTKDGKIIYVKIRGQKIDMEGRPLQLAVIDDITSEIEAKIQAQQAGQLARLGWWRYKVSENRFIWSDKLYDIIDVDKNTFEANFKTFYDLIYPEDRPKMDKILKQIRETNEAVDFIIRSVRQNGEISYLKCRAQGEFNTEGKLLRLNGVTLDITKLKQQEEKIQQSLKEKEALLEEIHHRVKNNLAIISSLLQLETMNYAEDSTVWNALTQSRLRIHSMAHIHEQLYGARDFANISMEEYISGLVKYICESMQHKNHQVDAKVTCDKVSLNVNQAVPCGLIINELVTHAIKHISVNEILNLNVSLTPDDELISLF